MFGDAISPCHKIPGQFNGPLLEVISEREVSQHLKKRLMAACVSYILKIIVFATCPNTLLRGGCPHIRALVLP